MTIRNPAIGTASLTLLAAAVCAVPAIAQTPTELETVRVTAPSITYRKEHQSGTALPPSVVAEKSALVKFGDLDLRLPGDRGVLNERIATTAQQLCEELTQQMPTGSPSTLACTDKAIEATQAQVRQAVHLHSRRK